jgi:hypothetical protein
LRCRRSPLGRWHPQLAPITAPGGRDRRFLVILFISREALLKLDGVGTASAILVDATVVRMVLVPEVMQRIRRGNGARRWRDRTCHRSTSKPRRRRADRGEG